MKSNLFVVALAPLGTYALAAVPRASGDTASDWDAVTSSTCADLAIIFARGTFDSGNIGVWVGAPFQDAVRAKFSNAKIAFQGVSPADYPADLEGYIEEGSPDSCARSLGQAVERYNSICPNTKFVISGWSQGALCAHKSLDTSYALASTAARNNVIALTTFGDPLTAWQDDTYFPPLPVKASDLTYCEQTTPDPLCDDEYLDWPSDPVGFIDKLKDIWNEASSANMNAAQKSALADLITELPSQAWDEITKLGEDILDGHLRRWLLTPEHFWYGLGPDSATSLAAEEIYAVYYS